MSNYIFVIELYIRNRCTCGWFLVPLNSGFLMANSECRTSIWNINMLAAEEMACFIFIFQLYVHLYTEKIFQLKSLNMNSFNSQNSYPKWQCDATTERIKCFSKKIAKPGFINSITFLEFKILSCFKKTWKNFKFQKCYWVGHQSPNSIIFRKQVCLSLLWIDCNVTSWSQCR